MHDFHIQYLVSRKKPDTYYQSMKNSHFPSPFPTTINHLYFLFSSRRLSSPTAGAAIIVRALEVSGRLGLGLLLVLFPETQNVVRNASEATLEARAFRRCHAG
jgi:hypothetical protein